MWGTGSRQGLATPTVSSLALTILAFVDVSVLGQRHRPLEMPTRPQRSRPQYSVATGENIAKRALQIFGNRTPHSCGEDTQNKVNPLLKSVKSVVKNSGYR